MPLIKACCCWAELEKGSRASAWFTGITAIINFIIDVWILVQLHWLDNELEDHQKVNFFPPGIIAFIYIELILNLCLFGLAFILVIGINRQHEGHRFIYGWVWGVSLLRVYQVFLGVYTLAFLGSHRLTDIIFISTNFIFVIFYWFLDTVILVCALVCVTSYWGELMDEVYGKFRRIKYFNMLANLRNAALMSETRSGFATPRSTFSRSVGSTLNMAPSQMSVGTGRPITGGNPYKHYNPQGAPPQHPMMQQPMMQQPMMQQQRPPPMMQQPPHMQQFQQRPPQGYQGPYDQPHPQAGPLPPKY